MERELHDGREDGLEPLEPLDVQAAGGFADMLRRMSRTAFGGRSLGEAHEVLCAMAADPDCTIVLTISGAMTVAKMELVICEMIENGLADVVISTGALMAHGLSSAIGGVHYKHDPSVPDRQLYEWGYNRVYDTLEMEANLCDTERVMSEVLDGIDWSQPTCSHRINRAVGKLLVEQDQMPSVLGCAYANDVPVYVPAFTDSELGLDVATFALHRSGAAEKTERPRPRSSPRRRPSTRSSTSTTTPAASSAPSASASSPSAAACPATGRSRWGRSPTSSTCGSARS